MEVSVKKIIDSVDLDRLKQALSINPTLANEGIPYDEVNTAKAHPLHRICDGVFSNKYTDEDAVEMAKIFLEYGANVNGNKLMEKKDTPLVAAASLHADRVAMLYIETGANIDHPGCHGGTALHWAAWCGREKLVQRLILEGAQINRRCVDFKATPLFWALHGLKNGGGGDRHKYLECVKILIQSGADLSIPNGEGKTVFDLLNENDFDFKEELGRKTL
jgi:ankyrin repeat protein